MCDRDEKLLIAARVKIDRAGKFRIRKPTYAGRQGPDSPDDIESMLPMMEVE